MRVEDINPYEKGHAKGQQVEQMFDSIARRYDFMNSAMSLGQHKNWRNKAMKAAVAALKKISDPAETSSLKILDAACGTGDVTFRMHEMLPNAQVTGIDLSEGMLDIARKKLAMMPKAERELMAFVKGDSLCLPFQDEEFNMITVAYGVRNFSNLTQGLKEMRRVLKRGGVLCVIELSTPQNSLTRPFYNLYTGHVIPFLGKKVTGDARAYSYLPESIAACPQRNEMARLLSDSGFEDVKWKSLSFGALTYYIAK